MNGFGAKLSRWYWIKVRVRVYWKLLTCTHVWVQTGFADWECEKCGKLR